MTHRDPLGPEPDASTGEWGPGDLTPRHTDPDAGPITMEYSAVHPVGSGAEWQEPSEDQPRVSRPPGPSWDGAWEEFADAFDGILWFTGPDLEESLYFSPGASEIFERSAEEFEGRGSWLRWVHPDDKARVAAAGERLRSGARVDLEYRILLPDGTVRWLHDRGFPVWNRDGEIVRLSGVAEDITQRKSRSRQGIERRETLLRKVIDLVPQAVFVVDPDGELLLANEALARAVGLTPDHLVGHSYYGLVPDAKRRAQVAALHESVLRGAEQIDLEEETVDPQGNPLVLRFSRVPLDLADGGRAILGMATDITRARQVQRELRERAFYDLLTRLPNRELFVERLQHALERTRRRDHPGFGVLFMDVDSFKEINDTLGHLVGDELLIGVADRLRTCVRPGDTVARFGGDEFAVLVESVEGAEPCRAVARRIHEAMREPFILAGERHVLSTSVGIALSSEELSTTDDILRDADTAMYDAKGRGPGRTQLYSQRLAEETRRNVRLKTEIREALAGDQLFLEFQPIIDLSTERLAGLEALLRWAHPTRGRVMPVQFLPVAEQAQLMPEVDRWVLRATAKAMHGWNEAGVLGSRRVSVNISAQHLAEPGFVPYVGLVLQEFQLSPTNFVIELTESSFIRNATSTRNALHALRDMGLKVALDDFGTGYSSLSHLHSFPIDIIKIDRSFVTGLEENSKRAAIVRATLHLGRDLGLAVTAEGIDQESQKDFLRTHQCDYGQGWLFDRALPLQVAARRLSE